MTAYGSWPGLSGFAELAEEAAQAKVLRAEVEALRGELKSKDRVLDNAVALLELIDKLNNGRCLICSKLDGHYPICALNTFLDKTRKEDTNA
ncbi:hypothetical protein [Cohnella sp. GCM10012308]|uniref:hypothetical protein n=1 Tax=Cohnella sp. GCM10012308 TaxID=3317329 RepID=UPI00360D606E